MSCTKNSTRICTKKNCSGTMCPVPFRLSFLLTFVNPKGKSKQDYRNAQKQVIREWLNEEDELKYANGPWNEYNPEIWRLINEVVEEN